MPIDAALLDRFDSTTAFCVGDAMLDHFVYGDVTRISPEAPIPVLRIDRAQSMLGGAANAVRNLASLGCATRLFAISGDDPESATLAQLLAALPGNVSHLERQPGRPTTTKTRYVANGQQLLRADRESSAPIPEPLLHSLFRAFESALHQASVVLLCDYHKGVLDGPHAARFVETARASGIPVVVDPKGRDFTRYRGATVIKPNLRELSEATGLPVSTPDHQERAAQSLLRQTDAQHVLVTCGPRGMLLLSSSGRLLRFPAVAREVYDVSGAGDTVAAVLSAALGSGASIEDAVEIANLAAGIVVGKAGTATVERAEILAGPGRASAPIPAWREAGLRIGVVTGRFDRLSAAQVARIEAARADCDRLLAIAPTPDASRLAASLACVDAAIALDPAAARAFIADLRPHSITEDIA